MFILPIKHEPDQHPWTHSPTLVAPEINVLPWDLFRDGLVSLCDQTRISSPLCDAGSDNNHQIPEKTKRYDQ